MIIFHMEQTLQSSLKIKFTVYKYLIAISSKIIFQRDFLSFPATFLSDIVSAVSKSSVLLQVLPAIADIFN